MTGVQLPAGAMVGFFLLAAISRQALGSIQPPLQWVQRTVTPGIKWPGCDAPYSPSSFAEVKNAWSYTSTPPVHLHGMVFDQARDTSSWHGTC